MNQIAKLDIRFLQNKFHGMFGYILKMLLYLKTLRTLNKHKANSSFKWGITNSNTFKLHSYIEIQKLDN